MSSPEFEAPVLSLPIMARMRSEYGEGPMLDAKAVMQNTLDVMIERFAKYCDDAYKRGLADGFMQGCLASDRAKLAVVERGEVKGAANE